MPDQPYTKHILELAQKWIAGTITEAEKKEFIDWYNQFNDEELQMSAGSYANADELKNEMLLAIQQKIKKDKQRAVFPIRKIIAAAVLLIIAIGGYLYFSGNKATIQQPTAIVKDVKAPDVTRATLQLADGRIVYLDSSNNGLLAQENTIKVMKNANGEIVYSSHQPITTSPDHPTTYNTITNPKGSKAVSLKLSDGTMVWLNAASSLRYPVAFSGNTRNVEITGEAYFEVAHDASKPFTVKDLANGVDVQVLGTHFNVNTYKDAGAVKVTLLEGSVKVTAANAANAAVKIKPGEQAVFVNPSTPLRVTKDVDLEQTMAWKNGIFKFNGEDLQSIMKGLERWYNVEVVYEGAYKPLNFGGVISRKENVSAVLDLMALTKQVKFRIEPSEKASAKIVVIQ